MRGFLSFAAVLVLAAASFADGWTLKSPLDAKKKVSWKLTVSANIGGQDHQATMIQTLSIDSKSDKGFKGTTSWTGVEMDGAEMQQELPAWPVTLDSNGAISSAGDSSDYARMLAPAAFVYPEKEVKVGDKWTAKFKPASDAKEITVDYEVVEQGKVGDVDALKIKGKLKEDGPMTGDDVFWVAKDGSVLKFDLDLKNWIVPFAGSQSDFDAKIHGEIVKA